MTNIGDKSPILSPIMRFRIQKPFSEAIGLKASRTLFTRDMPEPVQGADYPLGQWRLSLMFSRSSVFF
jgi:hypothetical protein